MSILKIIRHDDGTADIKVDGEIWIMADVMLKTGVVALMPPEQFEEFQEIKADMVIGSGDPPPVFDAIRVRAVRPNDASR